MKIYEYKKGMRLDGERAIALGFFDGLHIGHRKLLESAVSEHGLTEEVVLSGSFCIGKCNRVGVTVQVNDEVHVGITRENFREFFREHILDVIERERK